MFTIFFTTLLFLIAKCCLIMMRIVRRLVHIWNHLNFSWLIAAWAKLLLKLLVIWWRLRLLWISLLHIRRRLLHLIMILISNHLHLLHLIWFKAKLLNMLISLNIIVELIPAKITWSMRNSMLNIPIRFFKLLRKVIIATVIWNLINTLNVIIGKLIVIDLWSSGSSLRIFNALLSRIRLSIFSDYVSELMFLLFVSWLIHLLLWLSIQINTLSNLFRIHKPLISIKVLLITKIT